jgi:hypothetical protein
MINETEITGQEVRDEVERILSSQTLRGKETLQRLLAYLADRTLDGSAAALKECAIGVQVFGKPADYDPQEDASVRVQVGRLRQKLEEYARAEGVNDPLLIELPKRQFALQFHPQPLPAVPAAAPDIKEPAALPVVADEPPPAPQPLRRVSWPSLLLGSLLGSVLMALLWTGWSRWQTRAATQSTAVIAAESPELAELWQPFLASRRPLTLAMTMRPFLRYENGVIWDWRLGNLNPEARESRLGELRQQLKTARMVPWEKTYTSFGEATGIFLLTRLFERHQHDLQLKRSDALTWEEIAEQDVIFVGAGKAGVPFERIPVQLAFEQKPQSNTIINLHPKEGESAEYVTPPPDPKDYLQQEDYALISVVPGLHGKGEIIAFGAASSSGLWAAVEFMTEPRYARELVAKLKNGKKALPKHYQVVIHARFQSLVPVEISYLTHREL